LCDVTLLMQLGRNKAAVPPVALRRPFSFEHGIFAYAARGSE
jgi:hypothetical protein